ncbi:hypothetical protein GCM10007079_00570 [Nocardiopsis terrae]|uniref:Transposase DDE domain-containing protein n=1 Tax=Nocardiopsis terrae TaxID=372655 RepID=A0ABR9HMC6_9ACTN|nr:transposase [Nocardiopsis terrae]MBE1460108.1 hypothetical protein [Nocardiopsis terrae]GHC69734.1 hypothetical protein GCM10007079_00570 [Nocardiopsis terrae]
MDALHRHHAVVEDRVRCDKAMGLANLPSQRWEVNRGWMVAANTAHDLDAWLRLLTLHDQEALEVAEPVTMCYRFYHLTARLTRHLAIDRSWPWAEVFTTVWQRLAALPLLR